jgi:hypothetical protein
VGSVVIIEIRSCLTVAKIAIVAETLKGMAFVMRADRIYEIYRIYLKRHPEGKGAMRNEKGFLIAPFPFLGLKILLLFDPHRGILCR